MWASFYESSRNSVVSPERWSLNVAAGYRFVDHTLSEWLDCAHFPCRGCFLFPGEQAGYNVLTVTPRIVFTLFISHRGRGRSVLGCLLGLTFLSTLLAEAHPTLAQTESNPEATVTISIKTRRFSPNILQLEKGQKIRLVIRNLDAELHAFVPIGLLTRTTLAIAGNGAPEFHSEGLRRILLPSNGQSEIVFTPKHVGTFVYFCDLPGHRMQGAIVVKERGEMK